MVHQCMHLEDIMQLLNKLPLMISEFETPQSQVSLLCHSIQLLMAQGILQQVEHQVPSSGNIKQHQGNHPLLVLQDGFPCRENISCRVDYLDCYFSQLYSKISLQVSESIILYLCKC